MVRWNGTYNTSPSNVRLRIFFPILGRRRCVRLLFFTCINLEFVTIMLLQKKILGTLGFNVIGTFEYFVVKLTIYWTNVRKFVTNEKIGYCTCQKYFYSSSFIVSKYLCLLLFTSPKQIFFFIFYIVNEYEYQDKKMHNCRNLGSVILEYCKFKFIGKKLIFQFFIGSKHNR